MPWQNWNTPKDIEIYHTNRSNNKFRWNSSLWNYWSDFYYSTSRFWIFIDGHHCNFVCISWIHYHYKLYWILNIVSFYPLSNSITCTISCIGAAGLPHGGYVALITVLESIGIPSKDVTLIITIDFFVWVAIFHHRILSRILLVFFWLINLWYSQNLNRISKNYKLPTCLYF